MFVYSAISCEEMRSLPILFACVSTCRYRLRRAATPTPNRSANSTSSLARLVRQRSHSAYEPFSAGREPSAAQRGAERVGLDEVREGGATVDLHRGQAVAIGPLELLVARDVDDGELEGELPLSAAHD